MTEEKKEVNEISEDRLNEAVAYLTKAAEIFGFAIALPKPKSDDDLIEGFLVGTDAFIDKYTKAIDGK